jgi:hypothetical protein
MDWGTLAKASIIGATLTGCASTEVNYNAVDIATTYDTLITRQVAFNIVKTLKDEYSVPSFVKIATQTTQTLDAINPTLSIPFSAQSTLTESAASLVTGRSLQTAGSGLSLQFMTNRQQNYTLSPVIDPDGLRRIRSIYRYVTGHMSEFDFESDYPIIEVSANANPTSTTNTVVSGKFAGNDFTVTIGSPPKSTPATIYVRRICFHHTRSVCDSYVFVNVKPDTTFISQPGCVMCDLGHVRDGQPPNVHLLEKNPNLVGRNCEDSEDQRVVQQLTPCKEIEPYPLFFYRPDDIEQSQGIPVPAAGFDTLYLKGQPCLQAFYELALFTQEAASQGTGSPSSGGQSEGRKTQPLQPVSGPGLSLIQ